MAHYDVVVISSGFDGSVAALRAVEKGYSAGGLESGRRWLDEDNCHGSRFDVTNGTVLGGPAADPLTTYPVREEDEIKVAI